MKWDQIESKWGLMTRRIRTDFCEERVDVAQGRLATLNRRTAVGATIADSQLSARMDPESKTSAK